jgi:nicotinate phosphoribosyltransferase
MFKFKFDRKIKNGYYTASYFKKTIHIIKKYQPRNEVVMQFTHFHKSPVKVCGIEESVALLKASIKTKD